MRAHLSAEYCSGTTFTVIFNGQANYGISCTVDITIITNCMHITQTRTLHKYVILYWGTYTKAMPDVPLIRHGSDYDTIIGCSGGRVRCELSRDQYTGQAGGVAPAGTRTGHGWEPGMEAAQT